LEFGASVGFIHKGTIYCTGIKGRGVIVKILLCMREFSGSYLVPKASITT